LYSFDFLPPLHSFPTRRSSDLLVDLPERQLERHVDLDPLGLAVRELHVEPPATVEVDDRMRHRRVRALGQVVDLDGGGRLNVQLDRKSTRLNSSHVSISYAVFC